MKKIVKNILQKKELDKYLPEYGKEMSKSYYRFAGVCLAMNYFTLYEMANELEPDEVLNDINNYIENRTNGYIFISTSNNNNGGGLTNTSIRNIVKGIFRRFGYDDTEWF